VVRATGKAGYSAACTLPATRHPASSLRWPRVGVYWEDDALRFRLKTSPIVMRLRAGPGWRIPSAIWRAKEAARRLLRSSPQR
jgi:hypothetical protein